jgi:hypothetical protein
MQHAWGDMKCKVSFFENPEGKRQLIRPKSLWEDRIKVPPDNLMGGCGVQFRAN